MNTPAKYRKKPVVVEAMQFPESYPEGVDPSSDGYAGNLQTAAIYAWIEKNTLGSFESLSVIESRSPCPESGVSIDPANGHLVYATPWGLRWVNPGNWVVRDTDGDFSTCRPEDFAAEYELVEGPRFQTGKCRDCDRYIERDLNGSRSWYDVFGTDGCPAVEGEHTPLAEVTETTAVAE